MAETFRARGKGKGQYGKVHTVRASRFAGYHIQNCDGRAVLGMVKTDDPLTCQRCQEHEHR